MIHKNEHSDGCCLSIYSAYVNRKLHSDPLSGAFKFTIHYTKENFNQFKTYVQYEVSHLWVFERIMVSNYVLKFIVWFNTQQCKGRKTAPAAPNLPLSWIRLFCGISSRITKSSRIGGGINSSGNSSTVKSSSVSIKNTDNFRSEIN